MKVSNRALTLVRLELWATATYGPALSRRSTPVLWTKPAAFESQHGMTFCPCTVLDALSFVAYNATQLEKKNKHSHHHGCRHVSDDIGDIKY